MAPYLACQLVGGMLGAAMAKVNMSVVSLHVPSSTPTFNFVQIRLIEHHRLYVVLQFIHAALTW